MNYSKAKIPLTLAFSIALSLSSATAQPTPSFYQITVTSNQDTVQPDDRITLREAIELTNGTRSEERRVGKEC